MTTDYSREQLIDALRAEWAYLIHDDFNPEEDRTEEEYLEHLLTLSYSQLVSETCCDEHYPLFDFMNHYGTN